MRTHNNVAAQFVVGIGAQKSGTTWLSKYLGTHPQFYISPVKELHYFDAKYVPELYPEQRFLELVKQAIPRENLFRRLMWRDPMVECLRARLRMADDPAEYRDYFLRHLRGKHRAFGEITPAYSMLSSDGFDAIRQLFPEAKFVFLIRNPADRCWSMLRDNYPGIPSEKIESTFIDLIASDQCRYRTDYRRTIAELRKVAPTEDVLVIFFEALFGPNGEDELRRLNDFIGIDYRHASLSQKANEGRAIMLPDELRRRAVARYESVYRFALEEFDMVPDSWIRDLQSIE